MKESVYRSGWSTVNDSAGNVTPTHRQVVPRSSGGMPPAAGSVACTVCTRSDKGRADALHATVRTTTAVAASCGNALLLAPIGDFCHGIDDSATSTRHVFSPDPRAPTARIMRQVAPRPRPRKRPSMTVQDAPRDRGAPMHDPGRPTSGPLPTSPDLLLDEVADHGVGDPRVNSKKVWARAPCAPADDAGED
jgi:hypothetical protein